MPATTKMRIGELSRRVGVSPGTLRAWERRYGLPCPLRSNGGYRLYTAEDEARITTIARLRDRGVATSEAARLAREDPHLAEQAGNGTATAGQAAPSQAGARVAGRAAPCDEGVGASAPAPSRIPARHDRLAALTEALDSFDEPEAHRIMDSAVSDLSLSDLIEEIVLPYLQAMGNCTADGSKTPAHEHFGTSFIRGRLLDLSRGWGGGTGPLALLACPSGERHDLGLLSFGLLLREHGWRIVYFGQDTPMEALGDTASELKPTSIVLAATTSRRFRESETELQKLAANWATYIAGPGASRRFAGRIGATHLEGEPTYAAKVLAGTLALAA